MEITTFLYKKPLYWGIACLFTVLACGNPKTENAESDEKLSHEETKSNVMESVAAKRMLHYWKDFNFTSGSLADNPDKVEQKLVDFLALFPTVEDTVRQVAISGMLKKASADPKVLDYFLEKYKHYLYDPNSPMRNEDDYGKVLAYLMEADHVPADDKVRYATVLELVQKNQVGTKAADFRYIKKDGEYQSLYTGTKPYKMLVFYDPTCTNCSAILEDLAKTPAVHNCIENDFLDIVAVNLHPDQDSWEQYQKQIPSNWINGWDKEGMVINDGLYNIQAYPTVFLLDKENTVLLKDAPLDATLRYLVNIVTN